MAMDDDRIGDDRLSAWLDGEGSAAERALVQAWLDAHPDDAERVRRWRADREALQALFRSPADDTVPPHLHRLVMQAASPPRAAWAAAAAGLLLTGALAGGGAVWHWQRGDGPATAAAPSQAWVQRAAYAHAVYVPEPRHAVEVQAQEEHLARWLTRRIDVPVKLFDLRAQGFELVGGRLLPDGDGKSAQLMYQDADGLRVTVYLRKPEPGAETAFRYERQGDLGLFYWVEEGAGYALVGKLPRARLLTLAEAIYHQHPDALPPSLPASR